MGVGAAVSIAENPPSCVAAGAGEVSVEALIASSAAAASAAADRAAKRAAFRGVRDCLTDAFIELYDTVSLSLSG